MTAADELEAARRFAAQWDAGTLLPREREGLFSWLRARAAAYCDGAISVGWESKPSAGDLAEWIGLDLGEPFESASGLTVQLLEAAEAAP